MPLRAVARVNLAAIERNVARLRGELIAGAALCAVVKADGYGHGAVHAARAAEAGGANALAVATAEEAGELRRAGLGGPIVVLGALSHDELPVALAAQAELVAWDERFVERVAAGAQGTPVRIHVKFDSGLGRLGTRDRRQAMRVAEAVLAAPALELTGAMTHFATADADLEFAARQLEAFAPFVRDIRARCPSIVAHAANSAATLRTPDSHLDMVRCGIAIYGCDPMNVDPAPLGLEPALGLRSYVAAVKAAQAGDSAGYGRTFVAGADTWLATVPIGYGDGFFRLLGNNCDVLIGGRRYPVAGTVSMDNITVDVGAETAVRVGDEVTVIGSDGAQRQTAEDMARRIGTISYEVVCAISARVPRIYHRDGVVV
jgi:alanine racemase